MYEQFEVQTKSLKAEESSRQSDTKALTKKDAELLALIKQLETYN